ncbi:MAG TPA: S41 family peptidase [Vicinamibacterales bacterium]|nr:S41 family peptidase [Acidobacteriota bacterium]HQX83021.1 S41 family peptidase [Vicinamibacterales bacterium]
MRNSGVPAAAVVVVIAAVAGGLLGSSVGARGAGANADRVTERYRMFSAALAAVERDFVVETASDDLVYGAIDGMLRTLDPHSSFLEPQAYARMRERQEGVYYGLGLSIVVVNDDITVTNLFEGTPAYRAGIRRGDVIAIIKGKSAKGWTSEQAVKELRGAKGTSVDISIRRLDQLIPLTVDRDEINITTVRTAFMIAPGTGYIRLQDFSETTDRELGAALTKLRGEGLQRLVLDLRDNPGGPLDQAIAVSNRFLKRGQMIVYTRGRVQNSDEDYLALEQGDTTTPLVVLVNRSSASASEIVAGAMQDHDRALVVGEATFGKALVQSVFRISNGAGLALTTGRYYTPSGRMIQRPWDGTFDEYLNYSQRDQAGTREHAAGELKYTDAGRKVYGGGGIEPDHFKPGPVEGFNPTRFSRMLLARGFFVGFAESFTGEGDTRPAAAPAAKHKVARGFEVTPAILAEFAEYLAAQRVKVDAAALEADAAFISAMIHYDVDLDLFGVEEARRNLSKVDPQAQFALTFFDEAHRLIASGARTAKAGKTP